MPRDEESHRRQNKKRLFILILEKYACVRGKDFVRSLKARKFKGQSTLSTCDNVSAAAKYAKQNSKQDTISQEEHKEKANVTHNFDCNAADEEMEEVMKEFYEPADEEDW